MFVRGCEKFVIALAYLFFLALVGSYLARFAPISVYVSEFASKVPFIPSAYDVISWKYQRNFKGQFGTLNMDGGFAM